MIAFICPHCMKSHLDSVTQCPDKNKEIPLAYINAVRRGSSVIFIFTIGYRGHTKTCFLSSCLYTLYHGNIPEKWPHFSVGGVNQETITEVHKKYVKSIEKGEVPPSTPVMFPTPLILRVEKMPWKKGFFKRLFSNSLIEQKEEIIFVFYDIGGEICEVDERIKQTLPILKAINTLIFLINLPMLIKEDSVEGNMHRLLNTVCIALEGLEQVKKKNIVLCFTAADLMWGKENIYGPLATRLEDSNSIPSMDNLSKHLDELKKHSEEIREYIYEKYQNFHNYLFNNFKSVFFIPLAPLGREPKNGKFTSYEPAHILDPILAMLRLEDHL